jgi:O-antigen/teichoic acid export membrane protein
MIGTYLILALQFTSTMIIARLLTPEEIGVYGAGFSVVALAHLFRDFGLNQYLIQEKELTDEKLNATFSLSLILSWFFGSLIFLLSGPIAQFFGEADVETLLEILSINFFAIPFGSVTIALLRKNLKFHITAGIGIIASLLGIFITLGAAYQGYRYFSMAFGALAETFTVVILSTFYRPKGLNIFPSLKGTKSILHFGTMIGIGNIVNQFSNSTTDALIAKFLGVGALGFFSRAHGTFKLFDRLFLSAIHPVVLPLFASSNRDIGQLSNAYYKTVSYSTVLAWPFFAFLAVYAAEIINFLYGGQWDRAIPLVRILCIGGLVTTPVFFSDNLFIACSKPQVTMRIAIFSNIVKLGVVVPACFINLEAVCVAFVVFICSKVIISIFYLKKELQIKLNTIISTLSKALPVLLGTMIPPLLIDLAVSTNISNGSRLSILMVCAFLGWVCSLALWKHELFQELLRFLPQKPSKLEN